MSFLPVWEVSQRYLMVSHLVRTTNASAPGKLFILGEYAVLEGAPALLSGVRQRAIAEISTRVDINNSGQDKKGSMVWMQAAENTSAESVKDVPLLAAAISVLAEKGLIEPGIANSRVISLDTGSFHYEGSKLGLGSSAALTVAVVACLLQDGDQWKNMDTSDFLALCMTVHRNFQGGMGSGADVATAVYGGCIAFMSGKVPERLTLPENLAIGFVWTGRPAGTTDYIKKLYNWREARVESYNSHLNHLKMLAEEGIKECKSNNVDSFIEIVTEYNLGLEKLSQQSGMMFYNADHQRLCRLSIDAGCIYKPSGAGGGDFGVFMSSSRETVGSLERVLQDSGYQTSLTQFSEQGAEVVVEAGVVEAGVVEAGVVEAGKEE